MKNRYNDYILSLKCLFNLQNVIEPASVHSSPQSNSTEIYCGSREKNRKWKAKEYLRPKAFRNNTINFKLKTLVRDAFLAGSAVSTKQGKLMKQKIRMERGAEEKMRKV